MNRQLFSNIDHGPLWVMTASRRLQNYEVELAQALLKEFISHWEAHGRSVQAEVEVLDNTAFLVAADGNKCEVTGCSKDKLAHCFRALGEKLSVDFFNRMLIPVINEECIELVHWNDIEAKIAKGELNSEQLFVDATIANVQQFKNQGFLPLSTMFIQQG